MSVLDVQDQVSIALSRCLPWHVPWGRRGDGWWWDADRRCWRLSAPKVMPSASKVMLSASMLTAGKMLTGDADGHQHQRWHCQHQRWCRQHWCWWQARCWREMLTAISIKGDDRQDADGRCWWQARCWREMLTAVSTKGDAISIKGDSKGDANGQCWRRARCWQWQQPLQVVILVGFAGPERPRFQVTEVPDDVGVQILLREV